MASTWRARRRRSERAEMCRGAGLANPAVPDQRRAEMCRGAGPANPAAPIGACRDVPWRRLGESGGVDWERAETHCGAGLANPAAPDQGRAETRHGVEPANPAAPDQERARRRERRAAAVSGLQRSYIAHHLPTIHRHIQAWISRTGVRVCVAFLSYPRCTVICVRTIVRMLLGRRRFAASAFRDAVRDRTAGFSRVRPRRWGPRPPPPTPGRWVRAWPAGRGVGKRHSRPARRRCASSAGVPGSRVVQQTGNSPGITRG